MDGTIVSRTPHFALHRLKVDALATPLRADASPALLFPNAGVWIGALVPKRWAKRAVTRNAIKRQIYTISAAFEDRLPVAAHVVRLRTGFDRVEFVSATSDRLKAAVRAEIEQLFARTLAAPSRTPVSMAVPPSPLPSAPPEVAS